MFPQVERPSGGPSGPFPEPRTLCQYVPHLITCPSGLAGSIRGLKVREERILADRKLQKSGGIVDELLRACWARRSSCRRPTGTGWSSGSASSGRASRARSSGPRRSGDAPMMNNMGLGFVFTAHDLASAKMQGLERNFSG